MDEKYNETINEFFDEILDKCEEFQTSINNRIEDFKSYLEGRPYFLKERLDDTDKG